MANERLHVPVLLIGWLSSARELRLKIIPCAEQLQFADKPRHGNELFRAVRRRDRSEVLSASGILCLVLDGVL
jgi:hypothetical protein